MMTVSRTLQPSNSGLPIGSEILLSEKRVGRVKATYSQTGEVKIVHKHTKRKKMGNPIELVLY